MTEIKKAPKTAVIEAWEHAQLFAKEIRSPFRFVRADLKAAQPSEIRRTDLLRNDLSAWTRGGSSARRFRSGRGLSKAFASGKRSSTCSRSRWSTASKANRRSRSSRATFISAGVVHSVKNAGRGNGSELATYIVEKGKPLLVPGR